MTSQPPNDPAFEAPAPDKPATPGTIGGHEADDGDASLGRLALLAVGGVLAILLLSYAAVTAWQASRPDAYVVDFYPQTEDRLAQVVIRWPSRGAQLEPIAIDTGRLPEAVRDKWGGNQPKRTTLAPDTILPAGRVIESDTRKPPGRYVIAIGRERVEVGPDSEWRTGL